MARFLEDAAEKTYSITMSVAKGTAEYLAQTTVTDLDLAGMILQSVEADIGREVWAAISPWEFVAAMPTIFALCRQSGNATAWFEQVTARAAEMHQSSRPLTSDEVIRGLLYGDDPNKKKEGRDEALAAAVRLLEASVPGEVITAMLMDLDVSDAELVAAVTRMIGQASGPFSQIARDIYPPKAPEFAARVRKHAARAVASGALQKLTPQGTARLVAAELATLVPPEACDGPNGPKLVVQLAIDLANEFLRRLNASRQTPAAWCRDFESHVDGGTWAQPLRKKSRG